MNRPVHISFVEHPHSLGQSYGEHLSGATGIGLSLLGAGCACLIHGLLPFLFTNTATRVVSRSWERLVVARSRSVNREQNNGCRSVSGGAK